MMYLSLALPVLGLLAPFAAAYDENACNNSPSLCNSTYNSVLHFGAHDSAFVRTVQNKFSSGGNQYFNSTVQLSAGVRLLQSQIHIEKDEIRLCHTSCDIFDAGLLKDWLAGIRAWMSDRPSEVVTLLLVNDDKITPQQIAAVFKDTGIDDLAYVPETTNTDSGGWPTLRTMIDSKKRLVVFLSSSADTSDVPYLLPEFDHVFETEFEVTDPSNYTCFATRPSAVSGKDKLKAGVESGRMGLMNRFLYDDISTLLDLYVSNDTYAGTLNSDTGVGNLKDGIATCTKEWGIKGGFVLSDYVDEGDPIKIVDAHNGVTNPVNREDFPPNPKKEAEQSKADNGGGWVKVQKLADRARKGERINAGQFIFVAGNWLGSFEKI